VGHTHEIILYEKKDGTKFEEIISEPAKETAIVMLPGTTFEPSSYTSFELSRFRDDHLSTLEDQKTSISSILQKLSLSTTHATELQWWGNFTKSSC
jgi:hypothetical protein